MIAADAGPSAADSGIHRMSIGDWVVVAMIALLLATAIALPVAGDLTGVAWLGWSWLLTGLAGLLVLLALRLTPSSSRRSRWGQRAIDIAAVLFPAVKTYRDLDREQQRESRRQADEDAAVLTANAERVANMRNLLLAFHLGDIHPSTAEDLVRNRDDDRDDDRPQPITLRDLAVRVAGELRAGSDDQRAAAGPATLADCLVVLYGDRFQHAADRRERAEADEVWRRSEPRLIPTLVGIVRQHDLFALRCDDYEAGEIEVALGRLDRFGLSRLVTMLRQEPRVVVDNMAHVATAYGLGELARTERDVIEGALSGIPYIDVATAAALQFARRLPPPAAGSLGDERLARLLELLYRDRFGRPTIRLWSGHKEPLIADLTPRLCTADRLGETRVGRDEHAVARVLRAFDDFDMSLAREVVRRLGALWDLAGAYAVHAAAGGLPAASGWDAVTSVGDLLDHVEQRTGLPVTGLDLALLDAPHLALDLLDEIGRPWITAARRDAGTRGTADEARDETAALSAVAAGLFTLGAGQRPDLAADLARRVATLGGPVRDRVTEILLARMWRRRAIDELEVGSVAIGDLVREWRDWDDDARREYVEPLRTDLLAVIRDQLQHGLWSTRLPIQRTLAQVADDIIREMHAGTPGLEQRIRELQQRIEILRPSGEDELTRTLLERIEGFDPAAAGADRERLLRELVVAGQETSASALDEVAGAVHDLERVDLEVIHRIGDLEHADRALIEAVHELAERDAPDCEHFVLTFNSRTGPLADLIDFLTSDPGVRPDPAKQLGRYDFVHYTPYARIGRIPDGVTFDDLFGGFACDLSRVLEHRSAILPRWDWKHHDVSRVEITMQQVAEQRTRQLAT